MYLFLCVLRTKEENNYGSKNVQINSHLSGNKEDVFFRFLFLCPLHCFACCFKRCPKIILAWVSLPIFFQNATNGFSFMDHPCLLTSPISPHKASLTAGAQWKQHSSEVFPLWPPPRDEQQWRYTVSVSDDLVERFLFEWKENSLMVFLV